MLTPKTISIVDYGVGNLFSVSKSIEFYGMKASIVDRPEDILSASYLILPGVGAFSNGMRSLQERNLIEAILEYAQAGGRLLGICLGMQILFSKSMEFGEHRGLNLISGSVVSIPEQNERGVRNKIPHIAWSPIRRAEYYSQENILLKEVQDNTYMYHVHSYMANPDDIQTVVAHTIYNECLIPTIVRKNNIYGCQFHPEKSGNAGLKILKNFCNL